MKSFLRKAAMLVLVTIAAVSSPAGAQPVANLYYQEVAKDGRVYVFNTPERFKAFSAGGEMGTALTLIGAGENGVTVVAENETAADLYMFKHNLPGYDRPTPPALKTVDDRMFYRDGRTNWVMKNGTVQMSNRLQVRYTNTDLDNGNVVDKDGSFRIRRFKTTIEGSIPDWRFKLQANWVGGATTTSVTQSGTAVTSTSEQRPIIEDAEIWYAKNPMATVWFGQGKAYFGRQELTSSGRQQFVDRSNMSNRFHPARQQGLGLIGVNAAKTFEYNLGIYNGGGRDQINRTANSNKEFMQVARVVWTPFGEYRLEESSHDYPVTPKLAIGGAYLADTEGVNAAAADVTRVGAEVAFKLRGFNAVGEFAQEERDPVTGATVDTDGYYLQAAYLFPNKKFELAGRYSVISPDLARPSDVTETGVGINWYFDKHTQKLQADIRELEFEAAPASDATEIRVQYQLIF
jgi:phosphate-selective porin OprO and OprP